MPDPALQAYLAAKYLSGPKADAILAKHGSDEKVRKKRKRDDAAEAGGGLLIKDELESWKQDAPSGNVEGDADPQFVRDGNVSRETKFCKAFDRSKQGASGDDNRPATASADWVTVEVGSMGAAQPTDDGVAAVLDDNASASTSTAAQKPKPPLARAGLMTKEDIRAQRLERERAEAEKRARDEAEAEAAAAAGVEIASHHQTIYRDRSGRRIDTAQEDEERRQAALRAQAKQRERAQWGTGVAQREQARAQRARLEQARGEAVARHADDARMNDQLRAMQRVDDPALAFLTRKSERGPCMPRYAGPPAPPNRYSISPGYRWDGVNRSNGFEQLYFQKINEGSTRKHDAQAWRQEDM
ncbi:hypothetical protein K437DRAFT_263016 [Tilletiaria anomala UBC 951]|uniref:Pre-mRNA-splicing factor CWC26 n=1 Tax=Tilletiaria anomala (strain ATCC 24038 / CBS 436.72 / UBC 951) TaxID=1037660 RepID=A0A066VYA0_TILAU|nr:uncharacterized protein K437DRAFT_263016 [Tilletiaria anomala UBC 951]KDN45263.1 hypothetical protein K437DRAFT_263016 [Tilletiaria anomala UBC 951]